MVDDLTIGAHVEQSRCIDEALARGFATAQIFLGNPQSYKGPAPVSYTHLDVYKRQGQSRAVQPSRAQTPNPGQDGSHRGDLPTGC